MIATMGFLLIIGGASLVFGFWPVALVMAGIFALVFATELQN